MLNPLIQNNLAQIITLFQKHKIKNAYVFGSVLNANFNNESDVDFLVNLQEG